MIVKHLFTVVGQASSSRDQLFVDICCIKLNSFVDVRLPISALL